MSTYDCVILGAGIHGLCTAFWLHQRGCRRLCVLEQFGSGHERGSSHGRTRITRCLYQDPDLVALAQRANDLGWPRLEAALGQSLRLPTPGVFFGPDDGPIADYVAATAHCRDRTEVLDGRAAARRFPLLRIAAEHAALVDHTAAVLLAARTMQGLRHWLQAHGVELRWHHRVQRLETTPDGFTAHTDAGSLTAAAAVLAAGAWLPRLRPLRPAATVLAQHVGYFEVDATPSACRAGTFPVWARLGHEPNDFLYGLPDVDDSGLKAAVHRTAGPGIDPDGEPEPTDPNVLLALGADCFAARVLRLRATERCLYTMAAGHRLQVERGPDGLVTIAACSGHAFKFGPVLGERAAALVMADR